MKKAFIHTVVVNKLALLMVFLVFFSESVFSESLYNRKDIKIPENEINNCETEYVLKGFSVLDENIQAGHERDLKSVFDAGLKLKPSKILLIGYADLLGKESDSEKMTNKRLKIVKDYIQMLKNKNQESNLIIETSNNVENKKIGKTPFRSDLLFKENTVENRTVSFVFLECTRTKEIIKLGTAPDDGVYYGVGKAFERFLKDKTDSTINIEVVSTKGSKDNLNLIDKGNIQLAFTTRETLINYIDNNKNIKIGIISDLWDDLLYFIMLSKDKNKASSIEEVLTKQNIKVCAQDKNSSTYDLVKKLIDILGVDKNLIDNKNCSNGYYSSIEGLAKRDYEVVAMQAGYPLSIIEKFLKINDFKLTDEPQEQYKFKLVGFDKDRKNFDFAKKLRMTMLRKYYNNNIEEIRTLSDRNLFVSSADMNEETLNKVGVLFSEFITQFSQENCEGVECEVSQNILDVKNEKLCKGDNQFLVTNDNLFRVFDTTKSIYCTQ